MLNSKALILSLKFLCPKDFRYWAGKLDQRIKIHAVQVWGSEFKCPKTTENTSKQLWGGKEAKTRKSLDDVWPENLEHRVGYVSR